MTGTRDKLPSPISTQLRYLKINRAQSPKLILTSRSGALPLKDTLLTLDQEHLTLFFSKMKELEQYLRTIYSDRCQPDIMTETVATFPNQDMPTIVDLVIKRPRKMER